MILTTILSLVSLNVLYAIGLFLWFLSAMYFLRRKRRLREKLGLFFYIVVGIVAGGLPFDFFFQWCPILSPLIFLEFTPDLTFSDRMERYRENPKYKGTWRMRWADWICEHILNPFDPKKHHC